MIASRIKYLLLLIVLLIGQTIFAQGLVKTVTGTVLDKASGLPLVGVSVSLLNEDLMVGTVTDEFGYFELPGVPIGRQQFQFSYVGYQTQITEGVLVSSQRTADLQITMEEGVMLENVQIIADGNANAPINELATVSARSFSVEETERIAAGANDLGRMALSYPGVQQGGDDTENAIIVRGNSSVGILWRLEGIDIPNPNHFARPGTSGGGITVFSAQLLSKSDFYTGGMPAEFGNGLSGAFDVHFRKGNMLERQHRVRIGILGLDFATEGPIKKGQSSYLVNYRYSTLGLLSSMGFYLVGERVANDFQDLSFNLAFKGKDPSVNWTVFGISGLSTEHYQPVENPEERDFGIANHWEDRYRTSNMFATGVTYQKILGDKAYIKGTTAVMSGYIGRDYDTLSLVNVPHKYTTEDYLDSRLSTAWSLWYELNDFVNLKSGIIAHGINYNFYKENEPRRSSSDITTDQREVNLNGGGNAFTAQVYALAQLVPNPRLQINFGVHAMWLGLNKTAALDPRFSLKYTLSSSQKIGLALGKHSQMLPLAGYFFETEDEGQSGNLIRPNFNLPFINAEHYILSYTYVSPKLLKFNAEIYYQRLNKVPVRETTTDGYWMLNNQTGFPEFEVVSNGKGENYGVDLALEKFFSNKIFFLLTGSFFESNYILNNGSKHPTRFSTKWVSSFTLGKEFEFKKGGALQLGARVLYNGGFRYTPFDPVLSAEQGTYVPLSNAWWDGQVAPYSRIDTRISYRFNKKRLSGMVSLDIQNLTGRDNRRGIGYNAETNSLDYRIYPGSSFIPVLTFVFDF